MMFNDDHDVKFTPQMLHITGGLKTHCIFSKLLVLYENI